MNMRKRMNKFEPWDPEDLEAERLDKKTKNREPELLSETQSKNETV